MKLPELPETIKHSLSQVSEETSDYYHWARRSKGIFPFMPLARSLARRLEIVPTPKHGSWLNIAENELSALTMQCVKGRRFGTMEELREEIMAWAHRSVTPNKKVSNGN